MASLPKDMRRAMQCRYHRAKPIFRRSGVLDFQSANRMMTRRALLLATAGMAALTGLSARGIARFRPSEYSRTRGLRAAISVSEDRFGIPHVRAASLHDAYWAQGYLVARDRLFQLDLDLRRDMGRMAEVRSATSHRRLCDVAERTAE